MFREMRRFRQQLPEEETEEILKNGTTGILAVLAEDDYPYTVPVNYIYRDGKIYFHGAKAGQKYDAMKKHDKVSFCVIAEDKIVPHDVTDYFKSVVCFGRVKMLEEPKKKEMALALGRAFSPEDRVQWDMDRSYNNVIMYEITIEHKTGKEAIELTRMRPKQ